MTVNQLYSFFILYLFRTVYGHVLKVYRLQGTEIEPHPQPVLTTPVPSPLHPHRFTLVKVDVKHHVCHETSTEEKLALFAIPPFRQCKLQTT